MWGDLVRERLNGLRAAEAAAEADAALGVRAVAVPLARQVGERDGEAE